MLRFLKILGVLAAGVYLAAMVALVVKQRELMYFPVPGATDPAEAGFAKARDLTIPTADGEKLEAWFAPPEPGHMVLLYFHGNATRLRQLAYRFGQLSANGDGVLGIAYRGYGASTGEPTEEGLLEDADAAYKFLMDKSYRPEQVIAVGESLGSGVAVALAAKEKVGGVVLDSAYSSTVDVAADIYPYFPVRLLMDDQFRSDERIEKVKAPLLMVHGSADRIIPIAYGRRLFELANEPKAFLEIPDAPHVVLGNPTAMRKVQEFIAERRVTFAQTEKKLEKAAEALPED